MSTRQLKALGLITDPAPMGEQLPPGAMQECRDVVIRRPGLIESRERYGSEVSSGLGTVHDLFPYDGDVLVTHQNALTWLSDTATGITGGANMAPETGFLTPPIADARKNLYLGTITGVHKVTSGGATTMERAGITAPGALNAYTSSGSTVLAAETAVAYRETVTRTDANGVITVSAPTGSKVVANHHASNTYDVSLGVILDLLQAGDVIKIFRSAAVTSTTSVPGWPSDDLKLSVSHEVTAADISAGSVTLVDSLAENDRGEPLYTNPTREKITRANIPPPYCEAMALYKGSMFYANTIGPQSITLEADIGGTHTASATGVGQRAFTGDQDSTSFVLANVADTTGILVGMLILDATAWPTSPAIVTGVTTNTDITVDTKPAVTSPATAMTAFDTIRINNSYFVASPPYLEWGLQTPANFISSASVGMHLLSPGQDSRHVGSPGAKVEVENVKLLLREDERNGDAFSIYATHGDEYFPPLDEPTGTAVSTTADAWPNALFFSKTDQPEHVPLGNFIRVGSEAHPIQRIIATRNALWVFKTDGVYRLTGQGERSGWRVDAYDLSAPLIHRSYVTQLGGNVYAWTVNGVQMFGESGDRNISRGSIGNLLIPHQQDYGVDKTTAANWAACWANPTHHEVYFSNQTSGHLYIFNTKTGAWYRWTNGRITDDSTGTWASGCWNPADGLNYMGTDDGAGDSFILQENDPGESDVDGVMKWTDHTDGPLTVSRYQSIAVAWEDRSDMTSWAVDFDSSISQTSDQQTKTSSGEGPKALSAHVPRDHSYATRLGVQVSSQAINGEGGRRVWSLSGIRVNSVPVTTRVDR